MTHYRVAPVSPLIVPVGKRLDNPALRGRRRFSVCRRLTPSRAQVRLLLEEFTVTLHRFSHIRGHRAQVAAFSRLIQRGTPGHAYLFEGPEGVGKDMVAQALLARLACTQALPESAEPCGQCPSCLAFARGDHPDVTRLERDGATIKIDQVRTAVKRLRYEPVLGGVKGLIVESAELLREEAANAMLKTLEEPSGRTVFILVTSKPQLLLDTIRSRCQVMRFAPLSPDDVAALLMAEGQPAAMARPASALAEGSMTLARTLCNEARMAFVDHVVQFALHLGEQAPSEAAGFVEGLGTRLMGIRPEDADAKGKDIVRSDLPWILEILRSAWRDALMVSTGLPAASLPHARVAADLQALADRAPAGRIVAAIEATQRLEDRLVFNPHPRLAMTAVLVEAAMALRGQSI